MDSHAEFDSLGLPRVQVKLAWEARAKIAWGDPVVDVEAWLIEQGVHELTARKILAVSVRDRAQTIRANGMRDLMVGMPICVGVAAVWLGWVIGVNMGVFALPARAMSLVLVIAVIGFMFGLIRTWRGVARVLGGARIRGGVRNVTD